MAVVVACSLLSISCSKAPDNRLRLGVTTTLEDSGLLAELLLAFQIQHAISIEPIIAGSGYIHELLARGDIDTAITHDPQTEKRLLDDGVIMQRIALMQTDFVIVGPRQDPAHVRLTLTPDEAFEKIINSGNRYISRNDRSGTHQMEQYWWQQGRISTDAKQYLKTDTGMSATLAVATEKQGYTLSDRGSWLNFANKQDLAIVFEDPELLPNPYSLLSLSKPIAAEWEQWLQSADAKRVIANYRINGNAVYQTD